MPLLKTVEYWAPRTMYRNATATTLYTSKEHTKKAPQWNTIRYYILYFCSFRFLVLRFDFLLFLFIRLCSLPFHTYRTGSQCVLSVLIVFVLFVLSFPRAQSLYTIVCLLIQWFSCQEYQSIVREHIAILFVLGNRNDAHLGRKKNTGDVWKYDTIDSIYMYNRQTNIKYATHFGNFAFSRIQMIVGLVSYYKFMRWRWICRQWRLFCDNGATTFSH